MTKNTMSYIKVENTETEGENKIKQIEAIRISKFFIFMNLIYLIFSLGIWGVILYWSQILRYHFLFKLSNLDEATHVYIHFKTS